MTARHFIGALVGLVAAIGIVLLTDAGPLVCQLLGGLGAIGGIVAAELMP